MSFIYVLGMAIALAMDCFAVSMGMSCGEKALTARQTLRVAAAFGLFQFAMPVLGWLAGEGLLRYIERFDHWVALGLLAFVGLKMVRESFERDRAANGSDRTRGARLLVLAIATSIDALAVGLSLSVLRTSIVLPAALIGLVSFSLSVAGAKLGPVLGKAFGKRAELAGGLILIAIGVKIVAEHL